MTHAFTFCEVEGLVRSTPATGGLRPSFLISAAWRCRVTEE
jgi:hypothetical protein